MSNLNGKDLNKIDKKLLSDVAAKMSDEDVRIQVKVMRIIVDYLMDNEHRKQVEETVDLREGEHPSLEETLKALRFHLQHDRSFTENFVGMMRFVMAKEFMMIDKSQNNKYIVYEVEKYQPTLIKACEEFANWLME